MEKNEDYGTNLRERTKKYALRIIRLCEKLPNKYSSNVIGKQLLRSGTSVGAQYREACRAKSDADFISKMEGSLQELDESSYWLELLIEGEIVKEPLLSPLMQETNELIAVMISMVKKVKLKNKS